MNPTSARTRFPRILLLTLPIWLAVGGCRSMVKGEPEWLLEKGKVLRAEQNWRRAQAHLRGLVHHHPDSPQAHEGLLLLADTRHKLGKGQLAFEDYSRFVERYPQSPRLLDVAEGEYQLGVDHLEGRMPGFLWFGADRSLGLRILEHMQRNFRNHSLAQRALVHVAEWHVEHGNNDAAIESLQRFLEQYPRSSYSLWARFELARALFDSNQGPLYDLRTLYRSRRGFEDFLGTAKLFGELEAEAERAAEAREYLERIESRLAERAYETGRFYERRDRPGTAEYYYKQVMARHPESPFARSSAERMKELEGES